MNFNFFNIIIPHSSDLIWLFTESDYMRLEIHDFLLIWLIKILNFILHKFLVILKKFGIEALWMNQAAVLSLQLSVLPFAAFHVNGTVWTVNNTERLFWPTIWNSQQVSKQYGNNHTLLGGTSGGDVFFWIFKNICHKTIFHILKIKCWIAPFYNRTLIPSYSRQSWTHCWSKILAKKWQRQNTALEWIAFSFTTNEIVAFFLKVMFKCFDLAPRIPFAFQMALFFAIGLVVVLSICANSIVIWWVTKCCIYAIPQDNFTASRDATAGNQSASA